ncbi:glycoside hydrolase family 13 protein [Hymenobacter psychrotolerans]|uniref:Glycosidase n=1 Tax=Hymenobacter psychrotolerans DSM 18569 TaxID=1121959 RepID=A0A1M6QB67_9BACT|nr:glycoside hydrolase family 13 protein [Hymenobacter psychrotolerans]SHK17343.1 Glycosidase [Hymenobacter psychrotolerans DSM 18569]
MTTSRLLLLAGSLLASNLLPAPAQAQLNPVALARLASNGAMLAANAQKSAPIQRIDPTFWWVGMKNPKLQLLVRGAGIGSSKVSLKYDGVTLDGVQPLENPNYLLVNLTISPSAKPGQLALEFKGKKTVRYNYELRARTTPQDPTKVQGVSTADFVYLLMPDRFANGDPKNDYIKGMKAPAVARDSMYSRHGGDLKGIADHFDYLRQLGVTAIWPTPIVENNQPKASYHGYALTDFYAVDPRFGSNAEYVSFVQQAHQQGLKVVHDVVLNHMGTQGYLFQDAPAKDWFHQWPAFTRSNFRDAAFNDPYVSGFDRKQFGEGWFDTSMADLNQSNPLVSTYLIQNFIWWVEYTGLDAYRVDTYTYSDRKFLMDWGKAVLDEYPKLGMFAEAWVQGTQQQAYFARNILPEVDGFKSNMPAVLDFQSQYAINEALTKDAGWTEGINKLYYTLQADWLYEDPMRNVVFLDNHDMSRFYSVIGEDFAKYKMGLAWLLTTRGIPQLYYGTEVLMKNFSDPDGKVREDFPGGWAGDKKNLFTNRTGQEAEAFNYVSKLANYRKTHPALHAGKYQHFIPNEGVYTYFRYSDAGTVMVMMNSNKDEKTVDMARFAERLNGFSSGTEVTTDTALPNLKTVKLPGRTAWVVELKK